jgi:3'-phosphoadenosine 5'-phosphosulfate sulfotransferase (PAPS reductase)/FAD synthetase
MKKQKHVLGISGGKDSAALAVYMRQNHPELDIDYFYTDTGKELPEVYEFLNKLEGFLGKPILRLNPDRDFDFWLTKFKHFLPAPQSRWCTIQLKLKPFEKWIQQFLENEYIVHSYVAIRADENYREGYISKKNNLVVHLPLKESGIDKEGVYEILNVSGLGLPAYYKWRSRSGCTFCFFQQKIEWLGLLNHHPKAYEEAKNYEKNALEHGSPFTWNQGETLEELAKPERQEQIKREHQKRIERLKKKKQTNPLRTQTTGSEIDDLYPSSKGCLICHK